MAYALNQLSYLTLGKPETTYGTSVAIHTVDLPILSCNVEEKPTIQRNATSGTLYPARGIITGLDCSGNVTIEAVQDHLSLLFLLLGDGTTGTYSYTGTRKITKPAVAADVVDEAGAGNVHKITLPAAGTDFASISMDYAQCGATNTLQTITGVKANTLTISGAPNEAVKISLDLLAKKVATRAAYAAPTFSTSYWLPFVYNRCGFYLAAYGTPTYSGNITGTNGFTLTYNFNLEDRFLIDNNSTPTTLHRSEPQAQNFSYTLEVNYEFLSKDISDSNYEDWIASLVASDVNYHNLRLILEGQLISGTSYQNVVFWLPKARIDEWEAPTSGGSGIVRQRVKYTGEYDATNTYYSRVWICDANAAAWIT